MSRVQNRVGFVRGVGLLTSGLVLAALTVPSAATAQLYGAGRNNSAVVVDEDVLGALGGSSARPGVSMGVLPAPPAPPRSKINQIPPQKVKAAPPSRVAPTTPTPPAPLQASVPTAAPVEPPVIPAAAPPQSPRPNPGPPPQVPPQAPPEPTAEPTAEPPPAPRVAAIAPPAASVPARVATPAVAVPGPTVPSPTMTEKGARILFLPDSADLPTTTRPALDSLLKLVQSQPDRRILISAYAAGTPETASQARRLSLNRALTLRSFLAERGVSTARVDVRALGGQVADGPADRVDVELTAP